MKAQINVLETHEYTIFNEGEYVFLLSLPVIKGRSPKLVGLTLQQNPRGKVRYSRLHSAHQAVCPAHKELWATREEGTPFPNSHKRAMWLVALEWGGGVIWWSSSASLPDPVLITGLGKGVHKIHFTPRCCLKKEMENETSKREAGWLSSLMFRHLRTETPGSNKEP